MRKVVLYELMSLDGVADEPGEGEWFVDADERLMVNLADVIAPQDAVLLGRRTHQKWAPYWPTSDMEPFAGFINATTKYVFSSRPPELAWGGTTHVAEPAEAFVADLKQQDGGDIGIHGSLTLAQSLLRAGLVDELRLVVSPSTAGDGNRLFDGVGLQHFELIDSDRSGGCLLLTYRRRAS